MSNESEGEMDLRHSKEKEDCVVQKMRQRLEFLKSVHPKEFVKFVRVYKRIGSYGSQVSNLANMAFSSLNIDFKNAPEEDSEIEKFYWDLYFEAENYIKEHNKRV